VVAKNGAYTQSAIDLAQEMGARPDKVLTGMVDGFTAKLTDAQVVELERSVAVDYIEDDTVVSINAAFRSVTKTSTTSMNGFDDVSSVPQNLGFTINYFGVDYDQIIINSNGGAVFNDGLGSFNAWRGVNLSTAARPYILPLFTDLDGRAAGTLEFGQGTISDSGAKNVFWTEWTNYGEYPSSAAKYTFQMLVIDEGGGRVGIEFNYTTVGTAASSTNPTFEVGYANPDQTGGTVRIAANSEAPATVATRLLTSGNPTSTPGTWRYLIDSGGTPTPAPSPSPTDGIQAGAPWGLDRIDQRALPLSTTYEAAGTGSGVKVYVVDTGIRTSHTEFGGRTATGRD
jgi:hypothetical protein